MSQGMASAAAMIAALAVAAVLAAGPELRAAEEEANPELIQMVVDLVGSPDRDMRALGYQQIREETPGAEATRKFAALLANLSAEAQIGLLEALGDRGDPGARPAVAEMLAHSDSSVRAAAIQALGALGTVAEIPTLAEKAGGEPGPEREAALKSLARLRGDDVNAAIVAALNASPPPVQASLLDVLASRSAAETVATAVQHAHDADAAVRLAALRALRSMAAPADTAAVVQLVAEASGEQERQGAELALLALCSRGREACVEAILSGWDGAGEEARRSLLRALARAGGVKARDAIAEQLTAAGEESVRLEALRMLAAWPDATAVAPLLATIVSDDLRQRTLAVRGLVRLAAPPDQPVDLELLAKVAPRARTADEKRLLLGALGNATSRDALNLIGPLLDDAEVGEEASLAVVLVAEKTPGPRTERVAQALRKAVAVTKNPTLRERARKLLESN